MLYVTIYITCFNAWGSFMCNRDGQLTLCGHAVSLNDVKLTKYIKRIFREPTSHCGRDKWIGEQRDIAGPKIYFAQLILVVQEP